MRSFRQKSSLQAICAFLVFFSSAELSWSAPAEKLLEKNLSFPSPVAWRSGDIEISLIGLAWGPANSPEMGPKGREAAASEKPQFYPDRSYVLALHFHAKLLTPISTEMYTSSGLWRVKNVDGDLEAPLELTPAGFVRFSGSPGIFDVHFNRSTTTDYWDMFPVSPDQNEFLFQTGPVSGVWSPAGPQKVAFRIIVKEDDLVVANVSPEPHGSCLNFRKELAGAVGGRSKVNLRLTRAAAILSGTEQYARIGETLWLKGTADSLGNFVLEERYPKDRVTGIFQGKFSPDCGTMTGYFSKPDGSRLQPFEFREAGVTTEHDANEVHPQQE
jgi:hypothetical protein